MTVLNTANDGFFNVLIVLYRTLYAFGPMSRDRLLTLCTANRESDNTRLRQTLNRWIELGLFIDDYESISLIDDLQLSRRKKLEPLEDATKSFPKVVRRIVFQPHNNERFWDRERTRCADLNRGLAWLLAQDIYTVKLRTHSAVQELESAQLKDAEHRIVQNDVRWNGLRSWANYLGFLWEADDIMIDPTAAIRQDLALVFESANELTAAEFIGNLSVVIPVLDGGKYRLAVEDKLDETQWLRPQQPDFLSTSLSRALWRLQSTRELIFEARSDAGDSRVLQRRGGEEWLRFTHVRDNTGGT